VRVCMRARVRLYSFVRVRGVLRALFGVRACECLCSRVVCTCLGVIGFIVVYVCVHVRVRLHPCSTVHVCVRACVCVRVCLLSSTGLRVTSICVYVV
jgi:hypothetical protein